MSAAQYYSSPRTYNASESITDDITHRADEMIRAYLPVLGDFLSVGAHVMALDHNISEVTFDAKAESTAPEENARVYVYLVANGLRQRFGGERVSLLLPVGYRDYGYSGFLVPTIKPVNLAWTVNSIAAWRQR